MLASAGAAALAQTWPAGAAEESFASWLVGFRKRAQAEGITTATLDRALRGVQPIARVIELDQRQPEGRMSFVEYRGRVVNQKRIDRGIELLGQHRVLLERVRERFGVPPQYIVALWGIESNFGESRGRFDVIPSLATLAWDGRRRSFFEKELVAALKIIQQGHVQPDDMFGSWAGAMGQSQFMPSTFLAYAYDLDGDGRRDIWNSVPDVFASMAHYLARAGWQPGETWGREVMLPVEAGRLPDGLGQRDPLAVWSRRGIRRSDGGPLPVAEMTASLLRTDDGNGPAFLVYNNFRTVMVWNRSTYFALSVGLIADELALAAS